MLFFARNLVIITFKSTFVFRERSTPPLFYYEFDNERAPLVCCRDNVNKYANYTQSATNLCGSLKFRSKPSLTLACERARTPALEYFEIRKRRTNRRGFMSGKFYVELLWGYERNAPDRTSQYRYITDSKHYTWNFLTHTSSKSISRNILFRRVLTLREVMSVVSLSPDRILFSPDIGTECVKYFRCSRVKVARGDVTEPSIIYPRVASSVTEESFKATPLW